MNEEWPHDNVLPMNELDGMANRLAEMGLLSDNPEGLTRAGKIASLVLASYMGVEMLEEMVRATRLSLAARSDAP